VPYVLHTMPLDLDELLAPAHTAVLTMEVQRGVLGDLSMLPELADEVRAGRVLEHIGTLCRAARASGARVQLDDGLHLRQGHLTLHASRPGRL